MKIAVCVKEVPDAGPNRRIDPGSCGWIAPATGR